MWKQKSKNSEKRESARRSDDELGLGPGAARVGAVRVAREFDLIRVFQAEGLLEALSNLKQDLLALIEAPALATGVVAVTAAVERLADGAGPKTNAVEALADVDDDSHDLAVAVILQGLANSSKHDVQPEGVNVDELLVAERERPLATVLVLRVFPLGADALLEEVVVGLERKL